MLCFKKVNKQVILEPNKNSIKSQSEAIHKLLDIPFVFRNKKAIKEVGYEYFSVMKKTKPAEGFHIYIHYLVSGL